MDNPTPPSTMAVATQTHFGSHVLTIDEYTKTTAALAVGETIQSDRFRVGGHTWHIECCPRREDDDGVEWVSVFLLPDLHHEGGEVRAHHNFFLLDRAGKAIQSHGSDCFLDFSTTTRKDWGFEKFIQRKALESYQFIQDDDDCCRIRCDITVIVREPPRPSVPPPPWSDLGDLLLASDVGRDVAFVVGGELFTAHSCVLAARTSTAFMAEVLAGKKQESSASGGGGSCRHVRVDGVEPWVFRALLHFVYTDSLPVDDEGDLDVDARGLLAAADRYGMESLKAACTDVLCSGIYACTALPLLRLSQRHQSLKLNQACVEFVRGELDRNASSYF